MKDHFISYRKKFKFSLRCFVILDVLNHQYASYPFSAGINLVSLAGGGGGGGGGGGAFEMVSIKFDFIEMKVSKCEIW